MKYIASCSFGKDSLAMVLFLIEKQYPLDIQGNLPYLE